MAHYAIGVSSRLQMSECVVQGRMDDLRKMMDEFIANLEELKVPNSDEMTSC
jgi:hypothetical protein